MTDEELSEQSDGPEDVSPTKRLTRQLLDALGITRVINVDDDHAQGQIQSKESVIGALRAGTLDTVLVARFILPDEKDGSADALDLDEAITLVEERWEELGDDNRVELSFAASRAADEGPLERQPEAVVSNNAALLALPDLLGDDIELVRMGLVEWRATGQQLLVDVRPTLLLFDRSFENEGQSATAGDDLVRGVLGRDDRDHVYVGLLTHTASDEGREDEIAREISAGVTPPRPVIVVAKRRLQTDSFPEALRVLLFSRELEEFRAHAIRSLEIAGAQGINFMRDVTRYALLASFEAARSEGVFETDLAMRMPAAVSRKHLAKELRDGAFIEGALEQLRNAAGIELYFEAAEKPSEISKIEWDERFDDATTLSGLALPLEIGDIFRVHDLLANGKSRGADRYYILLAQACDLSVRADGKRGNELNSLVLTEIRRAVKVPDTDTYRDLKDNQADVGILIPSENELWRIQFARQIHVPTLALDACITSGSGKSIIKTDASASKSLPSSWLRRFERMKAECADLLKEYKTLEQGTSVVEGKEAEGRAVTRHLVAALLSTKPKHKLGLTAKIDPAKDAIEFGLERYARIADNAARGLLALLANHHARPAFDAPLFVEAEDEV